MFVVSVLFFYSLSPLSFAFLLELFILFRLLCFACFIISARVLSLREEIKRNKRTDKRTEMLKAREKLSAVSSNRRLKMQREIEMQADEVKSLQGQLRALGMGTDDDYMQDPFKQVGKSSPPAANQTKADEVSRPLTSEGRFPPIGGGADNSSFAASTLRVN